MDNSHRSAIIANENCYITQNDCIVESMSYYYGNISRETAEWILWDEGCKDGMYLLRESNNDYVLSLCHQKSVLHYRITRLLSGEVILQGLPQKKFSSPVTLIDSVEGLACKPSHPINASIGQCLPPTHWGLSVDEVREKMIAKALDWGISSDELNQQLDADLHFAAGVSPVVKSLVNKTLHEIQSWFHWRLSRIEAERRLEVSGHKDGKFLVRERDDSSYAICLSHESRVKHYRIDILPSGNLAIQDGPHFESIMALISHYTIFANGLWCALGEVCPRPQEIIKLYAQQSNFKISRHLRSYSIERQRNAINRTNRASTPTNIKIKEWFTTINHKWSRIKRQVVLHKHQPLISDNYRGDLSSMLTLPRHNHHHCCHNPHHRHDHNIHQFGRSHEEPAIGSGNIFNLNNDSIHTSTLRHTQNNNNNRDGNNESSDGLLTRQRLVKSSSIDTIEALIKDPIEEVRRLHLRQQTLTPPVPAPRRVKLPNNPISKLYANQEVFQRTQSLDDSNCRCNCSDWLLRFDEKESITNKLAEDSEEKIDLLTGNEKPLKTKEELADIFSPVLARDENQSKSDDLLDVNLDSLSLLGTKSQSNAKNIAHSNSDSNTDRIDSNLSSNTSATSQPIPPIIDLLKEFDICFTNDTIDDDSSTLTDNSSHSSYSPAKNLIAFPNDNRITTTSCSSNNNTEMSINSPNPKIDVENPIYEYDAIKLEQESIDKSASIGVADLDNTNNSSRVELKDIDLICLEEEPEEVHKTLMKYRRGPLCFDSRCITLKKRIGNGYFGDVYLATIPSTSSSAVIHLAVKMLKTHAVPQQKAEILREAQTMAKLDHKHIVRLIGVCEGEPFMLVMELAPLGPFNKYLIDYGQHMTDEDIIQLMLQVSKAMKYLEDKCYVHRDLAARNILLVNERFAKISDFGMSRALGLGKDYYKARSASKWPLKWYAPECIYYYKFSSKSDVWSYGVTLWEVMSRGEMPYQGMDGQDILRMFKENRRLSKPEKCPVIIYQLMWNCWHFRPEDRLNFTTICDQLSHYLGNRK